jgi:hypothetical protein
MTEMTPRKILDAVHEGLEESALLTALGYEASQGRPGRHLLNNALERQGYGRPIDEQGIDPLRPHQTYPDEWIQAIVKAISGRPNTPVREVIAILRQRAAKPTAASR